MNDIDYDEDIEEIRYQILLERYKEVLKENFDLRNEKDFLERREELRRRIFKNEIENNKRKATNNQGEIL